MFGSSTGHIAEDDGLFAECHGWNTWDIVDIVIQCRSCVFHWFPAASCKMGVYEVNRPCVAEPLAKPAEAVLDPMIKQTGHRNLE